MVPAKARLAEAELPPHKAADRGAGGVAGAVEVRAAMRPRKAASKAGAGGAAEEGCMARCDSATSARP